VPTRALVNELIDRFIERGECDFMTEFARPFPGLAFFDQALHAPAEDLEQVNHWATMASLTHLEESGESLLKLAGWIGRFIATRRAAERGGAARRGDVVDAVLDAEIEGRPITAQEAIGTIHLLILGGHQVGQGERVIMYWASANRDAAEFDHPDAFDPARERNRHLAFGAGPHRCVGSNLARMNLRIAIDEIARRLRDIKLKPGPGIDFHSTFNRAPLSVPITFTPGRRTGA
jgi:cytochrome P450